MLEKYYTQEEEAESESKNKVDLKVTASAEVVLEEETY